MNEIIEIAVEVDDILSNYVVVHDKVYKFSIRKILPIPGIFQPIDFACHYHHLDSLRSELGLVGTKISTWIMTTTADSSEYEFLTQMQKYVLALSDTISQLAVICLNMSDMSQAEHIYSPAAYKKDTRAYKDSVVRYRHLGTCLNVLFKDLP